MITGELYSNTSAKLEVLINEEWVPTRIEYADDWFLVCIVQDKFRVG